MLREKYIDISSFARPTTLGVDSEPYDNQLIRFHNVWFPIILINDNGINFGAYA